MKDHQQTEFIVLRIVWMLLFLLVWWLAETLLGLTVLLQLLYRLFFAAPHARLLVFGDSLSQYMAQIGRFATFNTENKPWPFSDWPVAQATEVDALQHASSASSVSGEEQKP